MSTYGQRPTEQGTFQCLRAVYRRPLIDRPFPRPLPHFGLIPVMTEPPQKPSSQATCLLAMEPRDENEGSTAAVTGDWTVG